MSMILVTGTKVTSRSEFGEKKLRCGRGWWRPSPWPQRLAPSRGGGGRAAAASSTGITTAEVSAGQPGVLRNQTVLNRPYHSKIIGELEIWINRFAEKHSSTQTR